jgi:flagellar protein FliL
VSAKPEAAKSAEAAPAKSKKMLIIIIAAVVIMALGGGGAFIFISKQRAVEDEEPVKTVKVDPEALPVYLPMDGMVVNLADQDGDRIAQVGITFQVRDAKAVDTVKAFLPTIRSGVLLQLSQRTSVDMLSFEGKEKLTKDILRVASVPFGGSMDEEEEEEETSSKKKKRKKAPEPDYPVIAVHFSSFIVQ